jgi:phage terminase large subunit-like protein
MPSEATKQYLRLKRLEELKKHTALFFYHPYAKQREFHAAGTKFRERLLMAGNQLGKTYAAGNEVAMHVTGLYPDDWQGKKFTHAPRGWVGSVTSELTRDGAQRILLGPVGKWGSGCIPKETIIDIKRARGVPDAVETILIKHETGDVSQITFKSYKDGREAWQAETLDFIWYDEEPPEDIYVEGVTRTNNTRGLVFLTFTPLLGMSNVVMRFYAKDPTDPSKPHPDRHITNMTIHDVEHYDEDQKRQIIAAYPIHEREARAMGIPMLGSGRIFPIAEEVLREDPVGDVPGGWKQIIGMDFGWDHPTAAVRLLYDEQNDVIHVSAAYRQAEASPLIHAAAIKPWGEWIPVAWPHDALQHDKSGEQYKKLYEDHGLAMLSTHASYNDKRGNGVEEGLMDILQRMQTGRFKVDRTLSQWWEEFRMYHRKDGQVVKERDDLMSATRYAVMMLRAAIPEEMAPKRPDRYKSKQSHGGSWMSM